MLEACGFRTKTYDSGHSFLDSLHEHPPVCVLLDLHMLGLTGWDVHAWMRDGGFSIPVIFMTGDGDPAICEKSKVIGPDALLRKPFEMRRMLDLIQAAIG